MLLLQERQARMRELAAGLTDGTVTRGQVSTAISQLVKMEKKSAEGSQATIDRSDHDHVKRSGQAALQNRKNTIEHLRLAVDALKVKDNETASLELNNAANAGGKKSVKAARKAPTVALFVEYLVETDSDFQEWLASRGVSV